jgi:hemoglobin
MVDAFYQRVQQDDLLGPIFSDVAHVNWDAHLPKMYGFWNSVLFGTPGFKGDPMAVHRELAGRTAMTSVEFTRWVALFQATVDDLFEGPGADATKARAERIATVMQYHLAAHEMAGVITPTAV